MNAHEHTGDPANRPSRGEAEAALRDAEQVRSEMENTPMSVPGWYFPALAACMAGVALAQLLPALATIGATVAIAAGMGFAIGLAFSGGDHTPRVPQRRIWLSAAPIVALFLAGLVLDHRFDQRWVWFAVAGVGAALVLGLGAYAKRETEKSTA